MNFDIKDLTLAPKGLQRIEWADRHMPVLRKMRDELSGTKPLKGIKIGACLHVTTETANLVRTLKEAGADVTLCASNPLSTQDDVAASLVKDFGIPVFAIKEEDRNTYYKHLEAVAETGPSVTMDDGCDLVGMLHSTHTKYLDGVIGGTEETTTGVNRLRSMENDKVLRYPVIAVNDSDTKHMFDNRYGTGQSTIDGLLRATNILLAGKTMVVCGYGWCGKGLASRARGMGATVIVTEVNAVKAIEAAMDGFIVMPLEEAMPKADVVITVTGNLNIVDRKHLEAAKDGVIIANSGHFNDEINIKTMEQMAKSRIMVRDYVEEYTLHDGRRIYLLADGRLLNLSAAEGHPPTVMDMSFANQVLAVRYIVNNYSNFENRVYTLPRELDYRVAEMKLDTMGIRIDRLTDEQVKYMNSWSSGT